MPLLATLAGAAALALGTLQALRAETAPEGLVATGEAAQTGTLSGVLTDKDTGGALAKALVILKSHDLVVSTTADADGYFSFSAVPASNVTLTVFRDDHFVTPMQSYPVNANQTTMVDLVLPAQKSILQASEVYQREIADIDTWDAAQVEARKALAAIAFSRFDVPTTSLLEATEVFVQRLNAAVAKSETYALRWQQEARRYQRSSVSLTLSQTNAGAALDRLLRGTPLTWTVRDREIVVYPKGLEKAVLLDDLKQRGYHNGQFRVTQRGPDGYTTDSTEIAAALQQGGLNKSDSYIGYAYPVTEPVRADSAHDGFAPKSGSSLVRMGMSGGGTSNFAAPFGFGHQSVVPPDSTPGVPSFPHEDWNREGYDRIERNPYRSPLVAPLSTFSLDVDTASYSNARRFIQQQNQLPPWDAVRIEEFVNYFPYAYSAPTGEHPLAVHTEVASSPWQPEHRLVKIGVKARELDWSARRPSNLVFLLDVSGSMNSANKIGLVKQSMQLLVEKLDQRDRVAIVVYAGASGLVLPPTEGHQRSTILDAINQLHAGGSTNAGAGIELAYKTARQHFIEDGNNRVILCTDGDFNVGTTDRGALTRMVEAKAKDGIQLTVLGFGMHNLKDDMLETLSNKGDGTYGYIDTLKEARKVFVEQVGGSLFTVARDVKIQVEFNPTLVQAYRLVGYENRLLKPEDFNDDTKDAGDVGAGHTVTAFYEVVPHGVDIELRGVDGLKYQTPAQTPANGGAELLTVKLRYKHPGEDNSKSLEQPLLDAGTELAQASADFRFSTAVAGWAMLLSNSPYLGQLDYDTVVALASGGLQNDPRGHRAEFVSLVRQAQALAEDASNVSGAGGSTDEGPAIAVAR
ncbi:MAG: von Willebrand factor type A domain-containing protein [Opitutales bacterium]